MIHILLADDHALFRDGVKLLLEREGFNVVGEAGDGREAVRLAEELSPDVIVMDLGMPGLNGIEAGRQIRRNKPGARMVLLTMYEDEEYMLEALRIGFSGYVLKAQTENELAHTISEVARGVFYLGPNIPPRVIDALTSNSQLSSRSLTSRERQVIELIAEGRTTKEIGRALQLSPKTIESHRRRIMRKLNLVQTSDLVCYAVRSQMGESVWK